MELSLSEVIIRSGKPSGGRKSSLYIAGHHSGKNNDDPDDLTDSDFSQKDILPLPAYPS